LLGHPPQAGYAALVEAELGIRLDKSETRTDWTRRPLSASQVDYAAADVAYLAALRARLGARLQGLGRLAWAEEDSAALLDPDLYRVQPERAWERFPNLDQQPPATQARARRLAAWRETRAASADRPRQWILSDQALMALASAGPVDVEGIARLDVLPAGAIRNSGAALLAELRGAEADLAAGDVAYTQKARQGPTDNSELKRLAAIAQELAGELGIAPELLATRGELTALLRGSRDLRALRGWRRQIIGDKLLAAL
jgi:ribonuclease D